MLMFFQCFYSDFLWAPGCLPEAAPKAPPFGDTPVAGTKGTKMLHDLPIRESPHAQQNLGVRMGFWGPSWYNGFAGTTYKGISE